MKINFGNDTTESALGAANNISIAQEISGRRETETEVLNSSNRHQDDSLLNKIKQLGWQPQTPQIP